MKTFKATVKEEFGVEYSAGSEVQLTFSKDHPGYFWILHPVTNQPTRDLVDDSLLVGIQEITKAA